MKMIELLAENPLLLLFSVIGLGYLIGNINVFGFKLGVAAVLFVGIAFGAIDNRLGLPEYIYIIGLVLFVYAVGLQAGPGFFSSFRKRGLKFSLLAIGVLLVGALAVVILKFVTGIKATTLAGLFCGALTNTPALAATVEIARDLSKNLSPQMQNFFVNSPVVAFGLAYPFGVFGVILWLFIFNKIFKAKKAEIRAEAAELEAERILSRTYKITNPGAIGKKVSEILEFARDTGFALSRIQKGKITDVVLPDTVLGKDDLIVAVGDGIAQEKARLLFGEQMAEHIPEGHDGISYRRIFVSNKDIVGKTIGELKLQSQLHATITRLRRGDVDFVPTPDTMLELGDRIRVVTPKSNMDRVTKFFGDSVRSISETDYLSLSLGIVLGVFLGMIPIPLPNGMDFKLGFAGGPLIAGLILGRLEKTGPIIWEIPYNANLVLRQVGLVFFLSAIGTKAGAGLIETFNQGGISLIISGAIITTTVTLLVILIGIKWFKLPMVSVMGMMSGIQTQPACLAWANQQSDGEQPNIWYATVYPASMVAKIILAQIIVTAMMLLQ
jgi:putative transport protein